MVDCNTDALNAKAGRSAGAEYADALTFLRPDADCEIACPYEGRMHTDLAGFDGAAFTGSGVEWNTDDPRAEPIATAMRAVFAAGLPTFGSCNGMQLAASVLGGRTGESPNGREDGMARDIRLTEAGRKHPMLEGRADGFAVPCVHRDEVRQLPEGAVTLATNAHSAVQAFAYEQGGIRFWGVQYHPEFDPADLSDRLQKWRPVSPQLIADLKVAKTDAEAAARLGTTPADQQPERRMIEFRNWMNAL